MSARTVTARWRRGSADPTGAQIGRVPSDSDPTEAQFRRAVAGFGVDRPDPATDGELAVLVLQVSWALGDAAHDLPAGRMSAQRREELADTLQALGFIVRASAPEGAR